jgi:hypothetical protein
VRPHAPEADPRGDAARLEPPGSAAPSGRRGGAGRHVPGVARPMELRRAGGTLPPSQAGAEAAQEDRLARPAGRAAERAPPPARAPPPPRNCARSREFAHAAASCAPLPRTSFCTQSRSRGRPPPLLLPLPVALPYSLMALARRRRARRRRPRCRPSSRPRTRRRARCRAAARSRAVRGGGAGRAAACVRPATVLGAAWGLGRGVCRQYRVPPHPRVPRPGASQWTRATSVVVCARERGRGSGRGELRNGDTA